MHKFGNKNRKKVLQILSCCNLFIILIIYAIESRDFYGKWRRIQIVAMQLKRINRQQTKIITTTRISTRKINRETTNLQPVIRRLWIQKMEMVLERATRQTKIINAKTRVQHQMKVNFVNCVNQNVSQVKTFDAPF